MKDDGEYKAETYENLVGARLPDAISIYETNGKTYVLTANEGDAREWGDYCNEIKDKKAIGSSIRVIDSECAAGLPDGKTVMFGSRNCLLFTTFGQFHLCSNRALSFSGALSSTLYTTAIYQVFRIIAQRAVHFGYAITFADYFTLALVWFFENKAIKPLRVNFQFGVDRFMVIKP